VLAFNGGNCDLRRAMNYVAVGQHETVRSEYKAGAGAAPTVLLLHLNVNDRGTDTRDCTNNSARVGVKELVFWVDVSRGGMHREGFVGEGLEVFHKCSWDVDAPNVFADSGRW